MDCLSERGNSVFQDDCVTITNHFAYADRKTNVRMRNGNIDAACGTQKLPMQPASKTNVLPEHI